MLLDAEITELINDKVDVIKQQIKAVPDIMRTDSKKVFDKNKLPEFTPIYRDSVQLAHKVEVHSTVETFPETLFRKKAPNENEAQWEYRKENYRPKTKAAWSKALGSTMRIWNEQNWTLTFEPDDSIFKEGETAEDYFTKQYPEFNNIITFFKSVVHKRKFDDPNILVCNKPKSIPEDQSELIEPTTVLYRSDQVIHFNDFSAMVLLDERSKVKIGGTEKKEGLVFELYDDTNIYRITQRGKRDEYLFDIEIWFTHDLGELPCTKLKGIPNQVKNDVLYESFFNDAVPSLDEALYDFSNLQLSKVSHAFPQRVEMAERCDDCEGKGVITTDADGKYKGAEITCQACDGTGDIAKQSVLGVSKRFKAERTDASDKIEFPGIAYVEPGTDIYKFLNDQIKQNIIDAFFSLNIDITSKATGPNKDTATGKKIDREELFAFLEAVNDQIFGLLGWALGLQGRMRYQTRWNGFLLKKPTEFAIRNADELTDEIVKAKEAMLPHSILSNLNIQFSDIRFATNDKEKENVKLQTRIDALLYNSVVEITSMVGSGRIASWKATMHFEWNQIISDLFEKDNSFFDLDFEKQRDLIVDEAQRRDLENKPAPQNSAEQFVNAITNGNA